MLVRAVGSHANKLPRRYSTASDLASEPLLKRQPLRHRHAVHDHQRVPCPGSWTAWRAR